MPRKVFKITRDRSGKGYLSRSHVRTIRRRTRGNRSSIARSVSMSAVPYPAVKFCKLVYYDNYTLSQTAGTSTTYQWRLNSLYDPDFTSTGHQPYYFDQMTPLYGSYKVYGVKLQYSYTCDSGSAVPLDSMIVFRPTPDGTTPTPTAAGFQVEAERPMAMTRTFGAGGNAIRGVIKYSCRKILGMSKQQYNDDDQTGALVSTNPVSVPYLNFIPLSTAAASVHVLRCKFTFFCKFYNRKIVSGS